MKPLPYLLHLNFLLENYDPGPDDENIYRLHYALIDLIHQFAQQEGIQLAWESATETTLDPTRVNCGRCAVCGAWVTDREKPNHVPGLNNGAVVEGRLLCDEDLPKDHRWAF